MVKQVLGRGLNALLSGNPASAKPAAAGPFAFASATPAAPEKPAAPVPAKPAAAETRDAVLQMPLSRLKPSPLQPRKDFSPEAIQELADSIKEQGVIQPLIVRSVGDHYELIAGERRWRAAQAAGLTAVPVVVREADDLTVLELSMVENLQRENLNPIEEALGFSQLISQFKLTQEQAADKVGRSRAGVANSLRLLKLPAEVQTWMRGGRLTLGHAKVILGLPTAEEQYLAAERALRDDLSVRQMEEMVAHWQNPAVKPVGKAKSDTAKAARDVHVVDMENKLQQRFGTKVSLRYRQGKGSLEIRFFSDDELERILGIAGIDLD